MGEEEQRCKITRAPLGGIKKYGRQDPVPGLKTAPKALFSKILSRFLPKTGLIFVKIKEAVFGFDFCSEVENIFLQP